MHNHNNVLRISAAFIIGIAVGALAFWAVGHSRNAPVQIIEGYAEVNQDGTAISLFPEHGEEGEGYIIAGATWRKTSGPWNDTFPTCLEPLTTNNKVRMGIVEVAPGEYTIGRTAVVWIEALD